MSTQEALQNTIAEINASKEAIVTALRDKGVSVPDGVSLAELCPYVDAVDVSPTIAQCLPGFEADRKAINTLIIPNGTTQIGDYAFYYCYKLHSVKFPKSLRRIGKNAFSDCYELSSIVIPEGVTLIDKYAFTGCYLLYHLTLPSTLTTIADGAFQGVIKMYELEIPEGVKTIGMNAFRNCERLTSLKLPSTLESIGYQAFYEIPNTCNITFNGTSTQLYNAIKAHSRNVFSALSVIHCTDKDYEP